MHKMRRIKPATDFIYQKGCLLFFFICDSKFLAATSCQSRLCQTERTGLFYWSFKAGSQQAPVFYIHGLIFHSPDSLVQRQLTNFRLMRVLSTTKSSYDLPRHKILTPGTCLLQIIASFFYKADGACQSFVTPNSLEMKVFKDCLLSGILVVLIIFWCAITWRRVLITSSLLEPEIFIIVFLHVEPSSAS